MWQCDSCSFFQAEYGVYSEIRSEYCALFCTLHAVDSVTYVVWSVRQVCDARCVEVGRRYSSYTASCKRGVLWYVFLCLHVFALLPNAM